MATLHHHRPISVSVLSPLSRLRPSSAIPATLFSRSPLSGLMCAPISARAIRDKRLLGPLRGCATSDSAISPGPPPSSRIFIKGLSSSTSEGFLAKTFSSFGEVKKIKIITSKSSKQSLGLAYIWFAHEQDALMAVKEMNGKFLDGRFIAVTIAEAESPSKQIIEKWTGIPLRWWRSITNQFHLLSHNLILVTSEKLWNAGPLDQTGMLMQLIGLLSGVISSGANLR
ncbi:hypothetical protein MUK42_06746 [Musa troglodytarum]|uniref:RRM domain-containing protein n=1 Tax=Musa troglodytarum TaxID=320322 RepID=A0A9E7L8G8_9LILI|nr:hypothetical protein MUK42_06746 [Musa troglodytarum]